MPAKGKKKTEQPPQMSQGDREKLLSQAYNRASQILRERHRDEFHKLYGEHASDLGVEWTPRLTPEQKAEKELQTIFEAWPELRERYQQAAEQQASSEEGEVPSPPEPDEEAPQEAEQG